MATSQEYIEFVCGMIDTNFPIRYKKAFGEYFVYVNEKPVLLACDNTVFVKIVLELEEIMKSAERGFPYDGAKEHYILDVEDRELTANVVEILEAVTPLPKQKIRSKK